MDEWKSNGHGSALRTARLGEGLSQVDLGHRVGVTQPTIFNWEKGKAAPSNKKVAHLEEILGPFTKEELEESQERGALLFSAWVERNRSKKNWTRPELASRAGVTAPTIYSIESGKTSNPQKRTRKRLEHAFGEDLPSDIRTETHRNSNIEGFGELVDFNPYDPNDLPNVGGVYVFYDVSERPMYVGMAANIKRRIGDHKDRFWFKPPIVETASFVQISEDNRRREIEKLLIKFLKSNAVINQQNVDR